MEVTALEPEHLDFQEDSGIKNDQLRKEDIELIEIRSNFIEKIVECPALSELDREELLADDAVVAVLLG